MDEQRKEELAKRAAKIFLAECIGRKGLDLADADLLDIVQGALDKLSTKRRDQQYRNMLTALSWAIADIPDTDPRKPEIM